MKDKLTEIFEDTCLQYSNNELLIASCKNTKSTARLYPEEEPIECKKDIYKDKANILVSKKRSFEAASFYKGSKIAVLNFANSFNPGGGVLYGSRAQEESLCRCSTLYDSISSEYMKKNFYQKHLEKEDELATDDIIYSPKVKVFKSDTDFPQMLCEKDWFDVDVITCAAPNIYVDFDEKLDISNEKLEKIHEKRLRRILDVALLNGDEVVILGAFGCGAFGNPPDLVATTAKKVISEYLYSFKTIEFAVFCSKRDQENYEVFSSVIK